MNLYDHVGAWNGGWSCRLITYWETILWICHTWWDMAPAFLNGFIIEPPLCLVLLIIHTWLHAKMGHIISIATIPILIFSWEQWLEDQTNTISFQTIEQIFESRSLRRTSMLLSLVRLRFSTPIHSDPQKYSKATRADWLLANLQCLRLNMSDTLRPCATLNPSTNVKSRKIWNQHSPVGNELFFCSLKTISGLRLPIELTAAWDTT